MGFNIINMNTWDRNEYFNHFFNNAKCTYSITVNIDITNLYNYIKTNKLRFYPTFTWVVSKAINNYQEFKMAFDEEGRLVFFDEIGPSYSVLNYTSFNVNNEGSSPFLFPMVTWGKFFEENNKIIMPVTIQVHHAVADGYHCSLFFSDVKEISLNPEQYLK